MVIALLKVEVSYNNFCRFVDGKDYMEAVADAMLSATKEIYITDWQ